MAFGDGAALATSRVVTIGSERYRLATSEQAKDLAGGGARAWVSERTGKQGAPQEVLIPLASFHEGSGFTYEGLPNTYEHADGWDASTPGKLRMWASLATGATTTIGALPAGRRGWLFHDAVNGYLYMLRGRYVSKYAVNFASASWAKAVADFDLGATNVVAGRPALFDGKLYIPIANTSHVTQVFQELTFGGAGADAYAAGPVGKEAICFTTWEEKLVRAEDNTVEVCSALPLVAGNWLGVAEIGSATEVGNSSDTIQDLIVYDRDLRVRNRRGLWSLDPNGRQLNELPDLADVYDPDGAGGAVSNGSVILPHKAGLIRWQPQNYRFIGPEQEGGLDGSLSTAGWGRTKQVIPYGRLFFATVNNAASGKGAILSFAPSRGQRGPYVPHCHHEVTGTYEGGCIIDKTDDTRSALAVISVSANGLVATPTVYEVGRGGMNVADDPNVDHTRNTASFYTSRYTQPARSVQKKYRSLEWWQDASPASNTPGLQWWAAVDGGTPFQLLDSAGAAATFRTQGFQQAWFPTGTAPQSSVGGYVQLEARVPALTGGEVDVDLQIREMLLRAEARPLATDLVQAIFILDDDELPDGPGMGMARQTNTMAAQEANLRALYGRGAGTGAVAYTGPNNESGYVEVRQLRFQEASQRGSEPALRIAFVTLEVSRYD